jgi:glycosyltransferase involved in cell wall biosynthesis
MKPKTFILFHSPVFWKFPLTYYQETAMALSRYCSILYVADDEEPFTFRHIFQREKVKNLLQSLASYPTACTVFVPFRIFPGDSVKLVRKLNDTLVHKVLHLLIRMKSRGKQSYHLITHPNMVGTLPQYPPLRVLYECMDYPGDETDEEKDREVYRKHVLACAAADMVFIHNSAIEKICKPYAKKVVRIPVGYSLTKYLMPVRNRTPAFLQNIARPMICFVGFTFVRLDLDLLKEVAVKNPSFSFLFVGPVRTGFTEYSNTHTKIIDKFYRTWPQFQALANVYILGMQDFENIRSAISASEICIIPYDISLRPARFANAIKAYEYLAMGKPIVSTRIESLADLKRFIEFAGDADEFSNKIRKRIGHPVRDKRSRRETARQQDVHRKAAEIIKSLSAQLA